MKPDGVWMGHQETGKEEESPLVADLRLRLQGSEGQLRAARAEARRLARELAVARRLLKFSTGGPPPPRPVRAAESSVQRATLLTPTVRYHFDSCRTRDERTALIGWAFRPAPGWDGRATVVTLLFRDGAMAYAAAASRVPRSDVAAHFTPQGEEATGGARGLDGAGFRCEILNDSLPGGVEWEISLRLECAGMACEQATAQRLRL